MKSPEGRISDSDVLKGNVLTVFDINARRSGVKIARDIVSALSFNKCVAVKVDYALARYRAVVRFKAVNKHK